MSSITASEISERCIAQLAEILEIPPERIDPKSKFTRLGLDSAMSINLILTLEQWLGFEISPDLMFDYPTIAELSDHLAKLSNACDNPQRS